MEPRHPRISILGRDSFVCQQLRGAIGFPPGIFQLNLGSLRFGLATVEFCLVPAGIDDEKHFSLFYQLSRLETHFLNVSGDSRSNLD
jgi:hypothetical protein